MGKIITRISALAIALFMGAGCGTAEFATGGAPDGRGNLQAGLSEAVGQSPSTMIASAEQIAPPAGFIAFCVRNPGQCTAPVEQADIVRIDEQTWKALAAVNDRVSREITFEDDKEHYGRPEYWTIPTDGYGDCEDYALTKRKALIDAGLPEKALRIAVVRTLRGEGHAVLTVVTDRGDYVLDNREREILPWTRAPYIWISRQDARNPMAWVALRRARATAPMVASR